MFAKRVLFFMGLFALCALGNPFSAVATGHGGGKQHHEGEHMGPPPPPPSLAEAIQDIIESDETSDTVADMLEHLLLTPEEREDSDYEVPEGDVDAEEEIEQIFSDLLDENISEEANNYLTMMLGHMSGEHHEGEYHGEGEHHEGEHHEGGHADGWYCQICDLHFETREEMDAHAEEAGHLDHHDGWYCQICDLHFETSEEMDAHAEEAGHLEHHEGEHHEGEHHEGGTHEGEHHEGEHHEGE